MTCPECKGTGDYIGLNVVEPCRACAAKQLSREEHGEVIDCGEPADWDKLLEQMGTFDTLAGFWNQFMYPYCHSSGKHRAAYVYRCDRNIDRSGLAGVRYK